MAKNDGINNIVWIDEKIANLKKQIKDLENCKMFVVFQMLGKEGYKGRKTLAKDIVKYLADKGITVNGKGKPIRLERVQQQISAMVRDIKNNRGAKTKSWWREYEVDNSGKLVVKT